MEDMLRTAVNEGTGRNARLSIPNYGKTGTSQNNRDALFVGYAGDLVVGVWVGNDDNATLKGISGGGVPARIWRDFMRQAVQDASPASKPKPAGKPDPDGPIKPLDVPDIDDLQNVPIDLGDSEIWINGGDGVSISTEIGGIPLDLRLDNDGVAIKSRREEIPAATDR